MTAERAFEDLFRFARTSLIGIEGQLVSEQMRGLLKSRAEKALRESHGAQVLALESLPRMFTLECALIHTVLAVCAYPDHQQPVAAMRAIVTVIEIYRDPLPGTADASPVKSSSWAETYDLQG